MSVFNSLYEVDTRQRSVTKDTGKTKLDYLPWATAYSEAAKRFDDIQYEFLRQEKHVIKNITKTLPDGSTCDETIEYVDELPYFETPIGYEVRTRVTINGVTKEMNLPVYDSSYKSMGSEAYTYSTKLGEKTVPAAKMDDVYKSIMRCFAKNLAMWGIGLNLWTKEEAPESVLMLEKLRQECFDLVQKRGALSQSTAAKVGEICKEKLPEEGGDPRLSEDIEALTELKKELQRLRKIPDPVKEKKEK